MKKEPENKYFDRKSAKIRPSDLAHIISAFANADGGTIVIGINDKGDVEGIDYAGEEKINSFVNAPKDFCRPMPIYKEEFLNVTNIDMQPDRLLLLHIYESIDQIIRTSNDYTFLRIGDRTKELRGDDLRNLEYAKSTRHYEDEADWDATIDDLDKELLREYKLRIDAENLSDEQILKARGFIKNINGEERLSHAAVLLFAKNISRFYPNCRIRFLRYDGTFAGVGTNINIIRDKNIEAPLLYIIDEARKFIKTQLREFTMLNIKSGKFQIVPEYPEFAWQEGLVNAVTHREYAMLGSFIKVSMYDDRLEIESPGKLPNIVTVANIKETRYSRNPRISRVLTEFGWVRELNEGVNRIYSDMKNFFLDEPLYKEKEQSLLLVLKNNIVMRHLRQKLHSKENIGVDIWNGLDSIEQILLTYMINRGPASRAELSDYIKKSDRTILNRLNHLLNVGLIEADGKKSSPNRIYKAVLQHK